MQLSTRARTLQPSPTLAIDARAKELMRQGVDIVSLGAGEPDFDTPVAVVEAAHAAASTGKTKYTAVAGIPELREAIAAHLTKSHGVAVDASRVVVTNGAKQALFNALQALVDPGDEVVAFAPYWVSYPDLILLAGGRMVASPVDDSTREPDLTAFEKALTRRTRGVIVNTPNNPTGAVYSRACLERLVAICQERGLWILSDEIYERLVYDGLTHVSPAMVGGEGFERTIVASGFSKSYAMTGWRLGYMVGPKEVADAAATIQGQVTSNVNTPTQWAALAALKADVKDQKRMVAEFQARRSLVVAGMREALGSRVKVHEPKGAFYLLFDVRPFLGKSYEGTVLADDATLVNRLLERALVATVPGSAFGAPGFVRMSYATSRENLTKAVERIRAFLADVR
jgi:aspartate aminotransferase